MVYDPIGNLTNIAYPSSGTVHLAYDALNRLTNMVDGLGTTRYSYDAAGQLLTTSGPFSNDALTNTYSSRHRISLALQQPTGLWTNAFGWDTADRLISVTSPAGTFSYAFGTMAAEYSGRLINVLSLPNSAYITNYFDPIARVLGTLLQSSGGTTLDSSIYGYNTANERLAFTNSAGTYVQYRYDPLGQLTVATGSASAENRGYLYDNAWNVSQATNATVPTFTVDPNNELITAGGQTCTNDENGNLTSFPAWVNYTYDDENRLVQASDDTYFNFRTTFAYDGLGRLRKTQNYSHGNPPGAGPPPPMILWVVTNTVQYIYDGWRVIQERDTNGMPTVSYTRGLDLSGSLEGAGGIGGLLARSSGYSSGNWTSHAYYHADGNGNIMCLVDGGQNVVASYRYDPFGNAVVTNGTLATANTYRFSSKEFFPIAGLYNNSGIYYYGYRFYFPNLQRWINRDPVEEPGLELLRNRKAAVVTGEPNRYSFVGNCPISTVDILGLRCWCDHSEDTDLGSCLLCAAQNNLVRQVGPVFGAGVRAAAGSGGEYADPLGVVGTLELAHVLAELDSSQRRNLLRGEYAKELRDCVRKFPGENALQRAKDQFDSTKPR